MFAALRESRVRFKRFSALWISNLQGLDFWFVSLRSRSYSLKSLSPQWHFCAISAGAHIETTTAFAALL